MRKCKTCRCELDALDGQLCTVCLARSRGVREQHRRPAKYPLDVMRIGDEISVVERGNRVRPAASKYGRLHAKSFSVSCSGERCTIRRTS